jgi:electron transfer flavoprotein beta subunit
MADKLHIVCCIKQVPDTTQVKIDPATNTLVRAGVESICNPYDVVAVEAAVQLKEKYGGKVTVITMGPPQADSALRECLSLGADEAILLSDRAFAGADTLATSYTLSQAITKIDETEPVNLVMCGKQAIDGDTAQVGPGVSTRLGFNQLTYVSKVLGVDMEKNTITVRREVEGGSEIIESALPVLMTVELELTAPRYASLPFLVRALRDTVKVWGAKETGSVPEQLGLKGSPTMVRQIFTPPIRTGGKIFDNPDKGQETSEFLEALFSKDATLLNELLTGEGGR